MVRFFDAENKPLSPDVDRGFARFRYGAKIATYAILNREGEALVTPATVRPPHNFLVMLSFFGGGCIEAGEFYHLKYP